MKKDAYYFPHFCNARNDSKIIKLRRVLGIEGYGIYFMLLEVLREQSDFKYPISGIDDLAYEWHTSREKVATVIKDFELFEIIENEFFSSKLIYFLQPYLEKSERARIAANKRWMDANAYANALPMHSKSNASKVKESKVNKSKEIEISDILIFSKINPETWYKWTDYKKEQFKFSYKSVKSEQIAINELIKISNDNDNKAIAIINQSIANGWKGLFELKSTPTNNYIQKELFDPTRGKKL